LYLALPTTSLWHKGNILTPHYAHSPYRHSCLCHSSTSDFLQTQSCHNWLMPL
jgi:hypothetical protein